MNVPLRFQYLPLDGDNPDLDKLTSLHKKVVGSNDEHYCLLSFFPKKLRMSEEMNSAVNKYMLFVHKPHNGSNYELVWTYSVKKIGEDGEEEDITRSLPREVVKRDFEFILNLRYLQAENDSEWKLKLYTKCEIFKNGTKDKELILEQEISPIESSLLSSNNASFEDETGNNTLVALGNEKTTHFLRGHLSEYLVERKELIHKDTDKDLDTNDENPNNASVFVNQTASLIYLNVLRQLPQLIISVNEGIESTNFDEIISATSELDEIFESSMILSYINGRVNTPGTSRIGCCSINLHHAIPKFKGEAGVRTETIWDIPGFVKEYFKTDQENAIILYNLTAFPKSAIELSVGILDQLFERFKSDAGNGNWIYRTGKESTADKNAVTAKWKGLQYSELRDSTNDQFMKNLIGEYIVGFLKEVQEVTARHPNFRRILNIDWSQFIQKLLNPKSIGIPFTLIKIQVRDLRSGKPIKNALVSQIQFHSFEVSPSYDESDTTTSDKRFTYKLTNTFDSDIVFNPSDSKNRRIQKIGKMMGYYTSGIDDGYGPGMRSAIHQYLTSGDRVLSPAIEAPESSSEAHVTPKRDAYIDYIIQDFESNCFTDDDGFLNCHVPDQLLKNRKLNINISFSSFAFIQETTLGEDNGSVGNRSLKRPVPDNPDYSTGFYAEWEGETVTLPEVNNNTQNVNWRENLEQNKNFGWKISTADGTIHDFLKAAMSLEVKKSATDKLDSSKSDYPHFSAFYAKDQTHIVLFGMQWCQPVWEPVAENVTHAIVGGIHPESLPSVTAASGEINNPNNQEPQGLNFELSDDTKTRPYIVTRYRAGSTNQYSRGRDYGTLVIKGSTPVANSKILDADESDPQVILTRQYPNSRAPRTSSDLVKHPGGNKSHYGIDYYAVEGVSPVFAITGGEITQSSKSTSLFGNRINHKNRSYIFTYAHLHTRVAKKNDKVLSGTKIGIAGRDGNTAQGNPYPGYAPTHLHLEVAGNSNFYHRLTNPATIIKKLGDNDDHYEKNKDFLLNNRSNRLFPCDCSGGTEVTDAQACSIRNDASPINGDIPNVCWASRNLHCPYMDTNNIDGITPARTLNLEVYRLQSQLTYLAEDEDNVARPAAIKYTDPNGIDGTWGGGMESAILQFRLIHRRTLFPNPADEPALADRWWLSQPTNGDATWNLLNIQAQYPRIDLNRKDQ